MRRAPLSLLLSLAIGTGAMTPAVAGGSLDYSTGVSPYVSPYGVATPVPAPIPIPVYEAAWYLRADFAAGFGADPSVSTAGTPFAASTIGLSQAWLSKSFEPSFTGGVGVGYIWGPNFRTDLTVDLHSIMNAAFSGTQTYTSGGTQTLTVYDKTKWMSTILLANAYYDIRTGTAFTPYIGGGVGFAVNQLTRNSDSTDTGPTGNASVGGGRTHVGFAAAAMAGLTYDINSFVAMDVNYRFLYIDGSDVDLAINGTTSDVDIGGLYEHQIRVGLRLYID